MTKIGWLFLAGGLGALARWSLAGITQRLYGGELPVGTLCVNLLGCLMFGIVWTLAEDRLIISGETRFLILTGFMGAFTTFSTFAFESSTLLQDSEWLLATGNIVVHNVVGIVAVIIGISLGRWI